ncbi:hypothetical protein ES703_41902 [subsurface metagenome]
MAKTESLPKWATLDRKQALVRLFVASGGFCVFGHKKCLFPDHHYHLFVEFLISDWKKQDSEQSQAEWKAEQKAMHSLGERTYPMRGRFNALDKDLFGERQPLYYLEGQAVSGVTLKPFVRVRIASSYVRLYIDLSEPLGQVSKSKRRKAIRYGKPLPLATRVDIGQRVLEAIRDYLAH